ncbi:uncharacterized protein [Argopecten irradians]|uniref:uncharacterized protein isoform X2 n=1 Tax=Argopecten irradians TaxID=31199 RepID=UPI0037204721
MTQKCPNTVLNMFREKHITKLTTTMPYLEVTHESLARVDIIIHGLPTVFFDRTNNLSVWSIVELFLTAEHPPQSVIFCSRPDLYQNGHMMAFVVQISCSLTPSVHLISKYQKPEIKLAMSTSLHHIGNTSYSMLTTMSNQDTKEKLGDFFIKFVLVDRGTRKSSPIPKSFLVQLKDRSLFDANRPYQMPAIPEMPKSIFDITVTPRHSDLDVNQHVTTHRYIQFFTDCATEAAQRGFYKHFNDDMCRYPVEKYDITLLGESKVGDTLRVCTWQDSKDMKNIYFSCLKASSCVMKAVFVYGTDKMAPKIPPHYM